MGAVVGGVTGRVGLDRTALWLGSGAPAVRLGVGAPAGVEELAVGATVGSVAALSAAEVFAKIPPKITVSTDAPAAIPVVTYRTRRRPRLRTRIWSC